MSNVPPSDPSGFPSFPDQPSAPGGAGGFPPAPGAPGAGAPPPPPGAPGTPPPASSPPGYGQPAPGYPPAQPPGYAGYGQAPGYLPPGGMVKGPRPDVKVGGILCLVGAAIALIGVFLPWATDNGESWNGLDDFFWIDGFTTYEVDQPGVFAIIGSLIMVGLGITLIVAGRLLAVAIIAIISAVAGVIGGLAFLGFSAGFADSWDASIGVGAILQPIGPVISLAGAIVATAKRRKTVPGGAYGGPTPAGFPPAAPPPPPGGYPQG